MPRFVILEHDHPQLHWDLMLESGELLATWRLPTPPAFGTRAATRIGEHRRMYLDYEGPVSGDRGRVTRWDFGSYDEIEKTAERWTLDFDGQRLRGRATLQRLRGDEWQLTFAREK